MTNAPVRYQLTGRDYEILLSLDRCPLTARQLLKLSEAFHSRAFRSVRSVQERLAKLSAAGWVRRWRYATASRGASPEYYRVTLSGYRMAYGEEASPPSKRAFSEIGIAHQHHTLCLADFVVHTLAAAHRRGLRMVNFYRENALNLTVNDETISPDCAFEILTPEPAQFNFVVELDNGTERVRSPKDVESWQRKIRLYDQVQNRSYPHRFRVLIVTTRSRDRLRYILDTAAALNSNPKRSLFYGVHLADYLAEPDAVCSPCFLDHRGLPTALIRPRCRAPIRPDSQR
jgi:hypothetical protein